MYIRVHILEKSNSRMCGGIPCSCYCVNTKQQNKKEEEERNQKKNKIK